MVQGDVVTLKSHSPVMGSSQHMVEVVCMSTAIMMSLVYFFCINTLYCLCVRYQIDILMIL